MMTTMILTVMDWDMILGLIILQNTWMWSRGGPLHLRCFYSFWGLYLSVSRYWYSQDTWEENSPKHMACLDLGLYPSFQDIMRPELLIIHGGEPKDIGLHLFPLTDLRNGKSLCMYNWPPRRRLRSEKPCIPHILCILLTKYGSGMSVSESHRYLLRLAVVIKTKKGSDACSWIKAKKGPLLPSSILFAGEMKK